MLNIHILSPLIYILFVKLFFLISPNPNSEIIKYFRKIHNIFLSILSFFMFIGICYANYTTNKFYSIHNLLCLSYKTNYYANISTKVFLYSKYLEWLDTLFLYLSNKTISDLHYTHHMTTAILMYYNILDFINPHLFIFISLNCIVHTIMYWYYAFPTGFLKKYKIYITKIQIYQHIICLLTILYTLTLKNCKHNKYGNILGLICYLMYLFYFVKFYINNYFKNLKKNT